MKIREFRLAGSRQDKGLERVFPLTTHLWCWVKARTSQGLPNTHTHTHIRTHTHARARGQTDAGNDNTRWPKLAPCKNYELTKIYEICKKKKKTSAVRYITMVSLCNAINNAFDIHAISLWLLFIISSHGYICRVTGRMITDGSLAQWTWDANLLLW